MENHNSIGSVANRVTDSSGSISPKAVAIEDVEDNHNDGIQETAVNEVSDSVKELTSDIRSLVVFKRATTFNLQRIPRELQLLVWKQGHQTDRQILEVDGLAGHGPNITRMLPVPAALHTTSLARAAVLISNFTPEYDYRSYAVSITDEGGQWFSEGRRGEERIWFDPARDTLYWNAHSNWNYQLELSKHLGQVQYLMIRTHELGTTHLSNLCWMFPHLKEVKVYMGGIDLDCRGSTEDKNVRYVEVDLEDRRMVDKVSNFVQAYDMATSTARAHEYAFVPDRLIEWQLFTIDPVSIARDHPCWRRNRDIFLPQYSHVYFSLDQEEHFFNPVRYSGGRTWAEHRHTQEARYLGALEWCRLAGVPEMDLTDIPHFHMVHTKEYYQALETMPKLIRVAVIRLLGDVSTLWSEHSVSIGNPTLDLPNYDAKRAYKYEDWRSESV